MPEERKRTVTMTIYKIEADLIDASDWRGPRHLPGYTYVSAQGGADSHRWLLPSGERCWIGDRVDVTIIEREPEPVEDEPLTPPTKDAR